MVILYRVSSLARTLARRVVRVPHIGMANILAGREAVPEFLFSKPPLERIEAAATELLFDARRNAEVRSALSEVRRELGPPGASERAARAIFDHVSGSGSKD